MAKISSGVPKPLCMSPPIPEREMLRGARERQAPPGASGRPRGQGLGLGTIARALPLVLGLAVLILPRAVHAQCVPLNTSTFAGLKTGGCLAGGIATDAAGVATPRAPTGDAPANPTAFTASLKQLTVQIPATATIPALT